MRGWGGEGQGREGDGRVEPDTRAGKLVVGEI